jgi:hypothetical protein
VSQTFPHVAETPAIRPVQLAAGTPFVAPASAQQRSSPRSPANSSPSPVEPGLALEAGGAEVGVACKCRPLEPGGARKGRPVEPGVAMEAGSPKVGTVLKGRPVEAGGARKGRLAEASGGPGSASRRTMACLGRSPGRSWRCESRCCPGRSLGRTRHRPQSSPRRTWRRPGRSPRRTRRSAGSSPRRTRRHPGTSTKQTRKGPQSSPRRTRRCYASAPRAGRRRERPFGHPWSARPPAPRQAVLR